ncbi:MAG: AAA family ATPase [Nitrososphaerota archaeon]|nr:AAA family ATPase [Candidatus Bathyarchaeota archaeon]MDW8022163.1 AAA family ATPase [Nitrososphaerota archaeon]
MGVLQKIPTKCRELDGILDGGFSLGKVCLIYGEAETAKTTLAIQCAVNCAELGYKTLFVDCDGTFSARRLSQIARENFKKVAELIILAKPKDFKEQTLIVDQLTNYLTKGFGLIVFDTLTSLYRLEIAEKPEKKFELNRELNRQMAWLAQVARTQKIAVLATSQVRSVFDETFNSIEPVATRVLKFWADIIVAMKPTENPMIVKASVETKTKTAQPLTCYLKIEEDGLRDYLTR